MTLHPPPKKTFALIILDGLGHRDETAHNPTRTTPTPTLTQLLSTQPRLTIEASGEAVGLPAGQMGNSEVGHLHIGSGRKVPQDLVRVNHDIRSGAFFENSVFKAAIQIAKKNNTAIHVLGLLSAGGVHSHIDHLCAMIQFIHVEGVQKNYCHVICDGRDAPPKSVLSYVERVEKLYAQLGNGNIVSVIGRYFAMDRDNRWERTQKAYDLLTLSKAQYSENNAIDAIHHAYERGETDEFISPTVITHNHPPIFIDEGDVVIFMNFRADRARQLTTALIEKIFYAFYREKIVQLGACVTLTDYLHDSRVRVAYPPIAFKNTLGEYLSSKGFTQLRLAETEKYAHVTYFLNGGIEPAYAGESRVLISSPCVATYDLQPEMSAVAITDAFVAAIETRQYDLIVCNYANLDMLGHTGNEKAAEIAMTVIDHCLARVLNALKKVGGEALITADHGNIEMMFDETTQQQHTAHTTNLVPLIYVGRPARPVRNTGALDDVAPTLLYFMGLPIPTEMTGKILFQLNH